MAQYKPNDFVKEYHGKLCSHSDVSFAKKKKTLYTMKRCNERDLTRHPYTAGETRVKAIFRNTHTAMAALTEQEWAAYRTAWAAYKGTQYSYFRGFVFGQEFQKAKAIYDGN